MKELSTSWKSLLVDRDIVLRGLRFAVVVGIILVAINHGDAVLRGDIDSERLGRIVLTVIVPYCVSVFSSISAIRRMQHRIS